MPRIPGSSGHISTPPTPAAPPRGAASSGLTVSETTRVAPSVADGFGAGRTSSVFEAYFAPYDPASAAELGLLDQVLEARKADATVYPPGENPYSIHYAVYNLRSPGIIQKLIEAAKAGVDVKVLIEHKQIAPEATWNKVDDIFQDAGLKVILKDGNVPEAEREAAHLVGIESNHLMHLKSRIFQYKDPASGEIRKAVLSGSMNPGDGANLNDENLNLIEDGSIVDIYEKKFDDVMRHKRTENVWDADRGINVLFTPCKSGPRPIEKMFEWMDQEQDLILLSVFDLNNIQEPGTKKTLVEKLKAAKDRGVEVVVITDRKKSDGLDQHGNRVEMYGHFAANDWTDEDLEKLGIPVYEFVNENGEFNAMHPKAAMFGLDDIKVLTGAGNWTRNSMGSANKRGRNEESFIFVESGKLDDNRTGMRYLSNFLYLLRHYDHQNTEHEPAEALIKRLQAKDGWPKVQLEPSSLVPPGFEGEAYLVGDHPALQGSHGEPGLKIDTRHTALGAMLGGPVELPFGTELTYDLVTRAPDGSLKTLKDDARLVLIPSDQAPRMPYGVSAPTSPSATNATSTTTPAPSTPVTPTTPAPSTPTTTATPGRPAPPTAISTTALGLLASDQQELTIQHNQLLRQIETAVATFPAAAQSGVRAALETSTNRIQEALTEGRLDLEEAAQSTEMLREMVEMLGDLRTGNVEVTFEQQNSDKVRVWKIKAPDGDVFAVTTRTTTDDQGEARVGLRQLKDDGQSLKGRYRMGLRLDMATHGGPSVDVQFGESAMDKRVHGLMRHDDGSLVLTPSGAQLADHHFTDNISPSLADDAAFASMVTAFIDGTMAPLAVVASPQ